MADFTSGFWSIYISAATVIALVICLVLLFLTSSKVVPKDPTGQTETTGHTWDETLGEYNNPLPRWWIWLFYLTVFFALAYLFLYLQFVIEAPPEPPDALAVPASEPTPLRE